MIGCSVFGSEIEVSVPDRPANRSQCRGGIRPCPYATCRYHLITMFTRKFFYGHSNEQIANFILSGMNGATCALDVADDDREATLDQIGLLTGQTRENIRQQIHGAVYSEDRCRLQGWAQGSIHRGGALRKARKGCRHEGLKVEDASDVSPWDFVGQGSKRVGRTPHRRREGGAE